MGLPTLTQILLEAGADPNAPTSSDHRTPLHVLMSPEKLFAAQFSPAERRTLLQLRSQLSAASVAAQGPVDPDAVFTDPQDLDLFTRAHDQDLANREILARILALPAVDLSLATTERVTPLHQAAFECYTHGLEMLVATQRAPLDARDAHLNTPLHLAAMRGFAAGVATLVQSGAPLELRNRKGRTPLEAAACRGMWDCVRILLSAGSSVLEDNPVAPLDDGIDPLRDVLTSLFGEGNADEVDTAIFDVHHSILSDEEDDAPPETPAGLRRTGATWAYRVHVSGSDGGSSDEDAGWSRTRSRLSLFPQVVPSVSDAAEFGASSSSSAAHPPPTPQLALDTAEIGDERDARISAVVGATGVSDVAALALLRSTRWDERAAIASYLRDPAGACAAAGILNEEDRIQAEATAADTAFCAICMDDITDNSASVTECEHVFCAACYSSYLTVSIRDGAVGSLSCPGIGCQSPIPDARVQELVDDQDMYDRYLELKVQAFVDQDPRTKWCPAPGCDLAVEAPRSWVITPEEDEGEGEESVPLLAANVRDVQCSNGHSWCFACLREAHEPADCAMLERWEDATQTSARSEQDKKTMAWLRNNTKPCPQCFRMLQHAGGCNHFRCGGLNSNAGTDGRGCGYEMCWLCLQPWRGHSSAACSRERKKVAKLIRDKTKEFTVAVSDSRMTHHKARFDGHALTTEAAVKLSDGAETIISILKAVLPDSVSTHFYRIACQTLVKARSALKYSYVRLYFTQTGLDARALEHAVASLEEHTENLAAALALPYRTEINTSRKGNLRLLRFAIFVFLSKARIWQLTSIVESYRRNLLEVAHHGHVTLRNIAATPSRASAAAAGASSSSAAFCSACHVFLPRGSYSNRQWGRDPRRCTSCIVSNRPIVDTLSSASRGDPLFSPVETSRAGSSARSDFEDLISSTISLQMTTPTPPSLSIGGGGDDIRSRPVTRSVGFETRAMSWVWDPASDGWVRS